VVNNGQINGMISIQFAIFSKKLLPNHRKILTIRLMIISCSSKTPRL